MSLFAFHIASLMSVHVLSNWIVSFFYVWVLRAFYLQSCVRCGLRILSTLCGLSFLLLTGTFTEQKFYHLFFLKMCFWCQSKSASPGPRFQCFVLCLFSKCWSGVWGLAQGLSFWHGCSIASVPFGEKTIFSIELFLHLCQKSDSVDLCVYPSTTTAVSLWLQL